MLLKFGRRSSFHDNIRADVFAYFEETGFDQQGGRMLFVKMIVFLFWFAASYWLLVFYAHQAWQAALLAVSLGLSIAGFNFNVNHDAMHDSYSRSRRINKIVSISSDIMGFSSYMWRWKHNVCHHGYTNVMGRDADLNPRVFRGVSKEFPMSGIYRFQYVYLWIAYCLLSLKRHWIDDFKYLIVGRVGTTSIRRPRFLETAWLLAGKVICACWMLGIPLMRHRPSVVVLFYLITEFSLGFTLSVVFQFAHCVEQAEFVGDDDQFAFDWAVHQIESTADFCRGNALLTWYLGGLNYQIEHHLFPKISHVHYPALAPVVERSCERWGVRYSVHESVGAAIKSHLHFLKRSSSKGRSHSSVGNARPTVISRMLYRQQK